MKTLAIDPGASGGLAWAASDGIIHCAPMPKTEGDILDTLRSIRACGVERVLIEDQVGCVGPNMRVAATAMFTFGRNFGFLLGAVQSLGFSVTLIRPQAWQKRLSLGTKKSAGGKTSWKNKLKADAQRRYPQCDVTLKTADALLLLACV